MAISPFSLLNDARPIALAGRATGTALDLVSDAHDGRRDKSFGEMVRGLDANGDGRLSGTDAARHSAEGAVKAFSALTGLDLDPVPRADSLRGTGDPAVTHLDSPPPATPVPPGVAGLHQLYDTLRAMR